MEIKMGDSAPMMSPAAVLIASKLQQALGLLKRITTEGKLVTVSTKAGKIKMFGIPIELMQGIKTFLQG